MLLRGVNRTEMLAYFLRRIAYSIPILFGVNLLIFVLFFFVNTPDQMARYQLGQRRITQEAIDNWKRVHGYDLPVVYNSAAFGVEKFTKTIFFEKSFRLFAFDFGFADDGRDISYEIVTRMWASLAIAIPTFVLGLLVDISFALFVVIFLYSLTDRISVALCVLLMSISGLFYIIGGQFLFGQVLRLVPISGYIPGTGAIKFVILPIIIGVCSGMGSGIRWYRSIFIEEMSKDYVRTARAKGLSHLRVLFGHVLQNGMIPILTGVVVVIPSLFMGSLIMESFFGIPGLGGYTIDAIRAQDFSIVRSMVFLGSVLYIIGLMLTDFSYAIVDPRVRLG